VAVACRRRADPGDLLRGGYGVDRPEALTLADASGVIDRLKPVLGAEPARAGMKSTLG